MAIEITCPSCRQTFRIKEKYAGRQGACPSCRQTIDVPPITHSTKSGTSDGQRSRDATSAVASDQHQLPASSGNHRYRWYCEPRRVDPHQITRAITEALADQSFRPRVPLRYRLYTTALLLWVVAMPAIYFALIILAASLVVPAIYMFSQIDHLAKNQRSSKGMVAIVLVALGGIFACLLMIRRVFVRLHIVEQGEGLKPEEAPLLFLLVDQLCTALGAVRPRAIYLDLTCNAAAGIGLSWRSMWRSDYTLTLGLPLVAGLTIQELAGVIAHELGHFNQSLACRLGSLVERILLWFERVVFQPDPIDDWLARRDDWLTRRGVGNLGSYFAVARLPTYATRKTLKLLMRGSYLARCALRRQQEFDADQSMCWIAGSAQVPATIERIVALNAASGSLDLVHNLCVTHDTMFDDYPKLVVAYADRLEPEAQQRVDQKLADRQSSWTAMHPPMAERITRISGYTPSGVLPLAEPAALLFRDFAATCRQATRAEDFSRGLKTVSRPTAVVVEQLDRYREVLQTIERFYRCHSRYQVQGLTTVSVPTGTTAERLAKLREVRQQLPTAEAEYRRIFAKRQESSGDATALGLGSTLLRHTARPGFKQTGKLTYHSAQEVDAALAKAQRKLADADEALARLAQLDALRLRLALSLLADPAVRNRLLDGDELARRAESYLELVQPLDRQMPLCSSIWERWHRLKFHVEFLNDESAHCETPEDRTTFRDFYERFVTAVEQEANSLRATFKQLRAKLGEAPYPFDHGLSGMTIGKFAIDKLPPESSVQEIIDAAWSVAMTASFTHNRLSGELAWIAERVEDALGLDRFQPKLPLEVPDPATPEPEKPWYQREMLWIVPRLCLLLSLLLCVIGLASLPFDFVIGVILLVLATVLFIGSVLVMA